MGFDAVGIISKNLSRTKEFYELLGLQFQEVGGPEHIEATTKSGVRIMVDSQDLIKKINPSWKEANGSNIVLCFKFDSKEEVDTYHAKLSTAGFKSVKEPWDAFWGQRYSSTLDPDNNQIDLFADLNEG